MGTILNESDRAEILSRIRSLSASSTRQWGSMDVAAMLQHLRLSARMTVGDLSVPSVNKRVFQLFPFKHIILYVLPFPKGAPTAPELKPIDVESFEEERAAVLDLLERIGTGPREGAGPAHPLFGPLTWREWGVVTYKHADHHLKQFGAQETLNGGGMFIARVLRKQQLQDCHRVSDLTHTVNLSSHVEKFLLWASAEPEIIAVALVGSHARGTATDNSDIDLIILAASYSPYLEDHAWLSLFGDVEWSRNEQWGRVDTVRAIYKTGVEIEFNFASPSWAEVPLDPGTRRVVEHGFKTLLDPQHLFDALQGIDHQALA